MLILSRRVGEEIVIDGDIRVRVTKVHGKRVRLAVEAPESVTIHRGEVYCQSQASQEEVGDATGSRELFLNLPTLETNWCLP